MPDARPRLPHIVGLLAVILASGCGGGGGGGSVSPGGGGGSVTPTPTPAATATVVPTVTPAPQPVTIDANAPALATMTSLDVFGGNFFAYDDPSEAPILPALKTAGVHMVRYPGGATSDYYHWQTNSYSSCFGTYFSGPAPNPVLDTDLFDTTVVAPLNADVNVTVNYGTNPACSGGADPTEGPAWVQYANVTHRYGFKYWTIGNEQYFSGPSGPTVDLHTPPGAATYANLVATSYYPNMKAVDPAIQVGVDLAAPSNAASAQTRTWDQTVLANATYDFVEVHPVPANTTTSSNDTFLLTQGPAFYKSAIALVKSELATAGKPSTPIYMGEWNTDDGSPPKEQVTIVGGLFAAMVLGEFLDGGVPMATFYSGVESDCANVVSPYTNDYGWPTFATFSMINESANASANGCPGASLPPVGTPYPPAIGMQIDSSTFALGDTMIAPSISSSLTTLRAYASKRSSGYGILLVNIDENNAISTTVGIANDARSFTATQLSYTKAQFDAGGSGSFPGAAAASLGTVSGNFTVTLPPWSMTGIVLTATSASATHRKPAARPRRYGAASSLRT
jgi:hypothetical protein